jgi:hypothetical protein
MATGKLVYSSTQVRDVKRGIYEVNGFVVGELERIRGERARVRSLGVLLCFVGRGVFRCV